MRNRQTKVTFPVFSRYSVTVIFARNVPRTLRRLGAGMQDACAAHVSVAGRAWIVFGLAPDEATVAHESSHAVRELLEYHGAANDDETFAYHLDFLVGRIHRYMRGKRTACRRR